MQTVSDKYYIWFNRIASVFGGVLLAASLITLNLHNLHEQTARFHFSYLSAALSLVQIFYGLVLFNIVARAQNKRLAAALAAVILTINIFPLIHVSGELTSPYVLLWAVLTLASGIFGLYGILAYEFIITIYFLITGAAELNHDIAMHQTSMVVLAALYGCGALSHLFWRGKYDTHESEKVSQLTGLLTNKQRQAEIIIQSIVDGVIVIDTEGKINQINPAASKMVGWEVNDAINIDVRTIINLSESDKDGIAPKENPFSVVLRDKKPFKDHVANWTR